VAEERGGAHQKASLRQKGSMAREGPWHAGVGVTDGVRAVGEGVLATQCLGWGRDSRRGVGVGCPWRLSDSEHGGVRSGTGAMK
jgi:hypothetical protein